MGWTVVEMVLTACAWAGCAVAAFVTAGANIIAPLVLTAAAASPNARFTDVAFMTRIPFPSVSLMCRVGHLPRGAALLAAPARLWPSGGRKGLIAPDTCAPRARRIPWSCAVSLSIHVTFITLGN